jgi:NADP-dependent 3-hydroxy acid dehydrogenase YdfG
LLIIATFPVLRTLAEHGAEVVLNGRDAGKLDAAAEKLVAAGRKVLVASFDVTLGQAVKEGVAAIVQIASAIDILVNNAGMQVDGRLKTEFTTNEEARTGAEELKRRLPMLQVKVYDAETKTKEEVQLP